MVSPTYTPSRRFVRLVYLLPQLALPLVALFLLFSGIAADRALDSEATHTTPAPVPVLLALLNLR